MAEVLLQAGADVLQRDKDGRCPMHVAASRGHDEVARLMVFFSISWKPGLEILFETDLWNMVYVGVLTLPPLSLSFGSHSVKLFCTEALVDPLPPACKSKNPMGTILYFACFDLSKHVILLQSPKLNA
jgi:hypothetical protein